MRARVMLLVAAYLLYGVSYLWLGARHEPGIAALMDVCFAVLSATAVAWFVHSLVLSREYRSATREWSQGYCRLYTCLLQLLAAPSRAAAEAPLAGATELAFSLRNTSHAAYRSEVVARILDDLCRYLVETVTGRLGADSARGEGLETTGLVDLVSRVRVHLDGGTSWDAHAGGVARCDFTRHVPPSGWQDD